MEHMPVYNPYDDPDVFRTVQKWRAGASVPFIEDEPIDREGSRVGAPTSIETSTSP